MSPEQARGDRIDRRADIYQLGCIAYEMLTGAPPFTGNRVFDILSKQVTEAPAPLPTRRAGIPLWLEASCAKMLAKDPENRFATTTRMVEALRLGLETGQVMEDEIARRRESIPPPSVSRVMQKMGIPAPIDPPAPPQVAGNATMKGHLEGPGVAMPAAANPPVTGKETLRGHLDPLGLPAAPTSLGPPQPEPQRRRTGTPQVGVPVQPPVAGFIDRSTFADGFANHHASQPTSSVQVASAAHAVPSAPVAVSTAPPAMPPPAAAPSAQVITPSAPIPALVPPAGSAPVGGGTSASRSDAAASAAGRSKRGSQQPKLSESSAWFDDGERASEEAENIRGARKNLSPSSTDMSLYDEPPRRRMWPLLLVGTLALGAVITIVVVASRGKDKPAKHEQQEEVATAPALPPTDVPPSQIISPDGSAGTAVPAGSAVTPPPVPPTNAVAKTAEPAKSSGSSSTKKSSSGSSGTSHSKVTTSSDDAASRRPTGGGWFDPPATTPTTTPDPTPTITPTPTPTPTPDPQPTGVSGTAGPVDPYGGGGDAPPSDGASPDKKAEFFANLGKQQLASGDTAGAAASFKKALELDSKNVAAVIGMGEIALRQGLFGDAIAHLKKATKLAPKSSYIWTLLGEAYLGTNNNSVAADTFKKALQLDPDNTRAREGFDEAQSKVPPATDD
jgi:hypothetical protein